MNTKLGGYMGRVVKINLSTRKIEDYKWNDKDRRKYIGGKIMAAKIIHDNVPPNIKAFSEENYVVISTGPLTGTGAPASSRFNVSSISPATGLIASSNCGGDFGLKLKKVGIDALVITGKSEEKLWLEINEEEIKFNNADYLWGLDTHLSQEKLPPKAGKLVIGPAGENLVTFAGLFSQERTAARAGLGAVCGYKGLKAISAVGNKKPNVPDKDILKEFYKKWITALRSHPMTGKQLPKFGTAGLVSIMQARGILATRNFNRGRHDKYDNVSGETLAETRLIRNKGCITCPIQCGRQVEIDGRRVKGPELETLVLLGPNIENDNLDMILKWNLELDELGMDTISAAGVIAFAMELNEKGLWKNGLEFGRIDNLSAVFHDIAHRKGIGEELSKGVKYLSEAYGGGDFAIHSKGLELSAYEPRNSVGQGLGYAVSNRGGCHLNAGYMVLMEAVAMAMDPHSTIGKAELTIVLQDLMEVVSAMGLCLFTIQGILPEMICKKPNSSLMNIANKVMTTNLTAGIMDMLNKGIVKVPINLPILPHSKALELCTGIKMDFSKFKAIGELGYNIERKINLERGLKKSDDSLPDRLTKVPIDPLNSESKVPLERLRKKYYRARGWTSDGKLKDKMIRRLGLN